MSFDSLGLSEPLVRAVHERGHTSPTPIQKQAIPAVLAGGDLLAGAQTGTGKTAGFTLPILNRLKEGKSPSLRALVLVPTRELAAQVEESIKTYGRFLRLKTEVVFGGVGIRPQKDALRRGVDILIATPGRLLDHLRQKHLNFRSLEVLVLDEADRMLDMGFLPDIRTIMSHLPKERQTLFFSATLSGEVKKLAGEILHDPHKIEVAPQGTPAEGIRQVVYPVDAARKRELLIHLMDKEKMNQVLVFTRTKHRANDLAAHLEKKGKLVAALHGDKTQGARTAALDQFKRGKIQVLVATNLAARGLDVKGITHVVNFEMPEAPEDYVHRIGRTARAQGTGDAISLMAPTERGSLRDIEQLIGSRIPQVMVAGFEGKEPVGGKPKPKGAYPPSRKKENSWRTAESKRPTKRW